jgi:hypothetical protein
MEEIKGAMKMGKMRTKNYTQLMITVTPEQIENMNILARKLGESKSALVREALDEYLRKHGMDPKRIPTNVSLSFDYEG